jgi:hypothetical protein
LQAKAAIRVVMIEEQLEAFESVDDPGQGFGMRMAITTAVGGDQDPLVKDATKRFSGLPLRVAPRDNSPSAQTE